MRGPGVAITLLFTLPSLAGCLGDGGPRGESPSAPPSDPFVAAMVSDDPGHDHTNRTQHGHAHNVTLVGHQALTDQDGAVAQSHSVDLCGDWLVLGREVPGEWGVDIVNVSDPADPQWVGRYRDANAVPGDRDVAWSADCNYVFMGNQGGDRNSAGVRVINAVAKANPVFESFYWVPGLGVPGVSVPGVGGVGVSGAVHTVYALQVGADQFVYALNYGVHILKLLDGVDGKKTLVPAGRYVAVDPQRVLAVNQPEPDGVATRRTLFGHDMTVYREGDRTIMYVAYAYDGLRIVDITNPATPLELAHWVPQTPGAPHYVHSVKSYLQGDRRITVVGSETFEDRNTAQPSPLWILDTTDTGDIRHLSTWTNPGGHGADHLLFSAHFYEIEDEILWLAHYHGGVWALDLRDPARPVGLGFYLPAEETGFTPSADCCSGFKLGGIPMTFDLKVRDGVAYAADFATGLYVLRLADEP